MVKNFKINFANKNSPTPPPEVRKIKFQKKANIMHQVVIQIILIVLIFGFFYIATTQRVNSKTVKQQVLEKQIALLIDSARPGMSFTVYKINMNGIVNKVELKEGKVYVYIDDQKFSEGYGYFSKHEVSVEVVDSDKDSEDKFIVRIK